MAKEELPEHAYLQSVRVKGFRTLKDSEVEFVPGLNIIIGDNGVGKSNLLASITNSFSTLKPRYNFGLFQAAILSRGNTYELSLELLNVKVPEGSGLGYDESPQGLIVNHVAALRKNGQILYEENINRSHWANGLRNYFGPKSELPSFTAPMLPFVQYNIPFKPSFTDENPISLLYDFKKADFIDRKAYIEPQKDYVFLEKFFFKIPTWMGGFYDDDDQDLLIKELKSSEELKDNLEKFSPISDFRLSSDFSLFKNNEKLSIANLQFEFKVNDDWLPWSFLSDGTKRLFYIIYEVTTTNSIILIEEPELGVHPHQFHSIMLFLKEQAQYKQIILTTHSPYALNVLKKDDLDSIIIAKLDKDKGSVFKHLNEEQKAKANRYIADVGFLSDYWMHSDLEDDEEED